MIVINQNMYGTLDDKMIDIMNQLIHDGHIVKIMPYGMCPCFQEIKDLNNNVESVYLYKEDPGQQCWTNYRVVYIVTMDGISKYE